MSTSTEKATATKTATDTATERLERLFDDHKNAAETELEAERQSITMEFARAQGRDKYIDAFTPGMVRLLRNLPGPADKGTTAGTFIAASPYSRAPMWGAILGAAYQLTAGLPGVMAAPKSERTGRLCKLAVDVAIAAGAAGLTAYAAKRLEAFLVKNASRILSIICNKEAAEAFLFKVLGGGLKVPAACGVLAATSLTALQALYYAATSAWANWHGDTIGSEMEWERMWKVLSLDNCLRTVISAASGTLAFCLAPVIGTGYLSFLIPVTLYFLSEWTLELAIARKTPYGGWSQWLASWFIDSRAPKRWAGGDYENFEKRIPEGLWCSISHEMVVDPVRSIRTGHLYEREQLYRWLQSKHKDPITRTKACSLDYVDSPCAAEHARRIGSLLNARPVPTPEETE
ncbi:hypothetical protein PT974_12364 [Cladobotryum mycophilum]|uniref:peptidylprolyl isomerase n=1 Tax=Cladobotryum mycophilum TaxID=491253 RepID=A0ABR0S7T4_9HYPO